MRHLIILNLFFLSQICFGQTPYEINYSRPTTLKINGEYKNGNEKFFDVEFVNEKNQKVKLISRTQEKNHSSKTGYDINNSIRYYFYNDTLLVQEIGIDPDYRVFSRIDYTYNENNKPLGWVNYSIKPKISKDSFQTIIKKDILLNSPSLFPTRDLIIETKLTKKYENGKLVYKCYYERFGELKTAMPAREQFFKYNDKGQLIEHISNPKSDAGGTAFLRQTFEYNDKNQVIVEQSFSDGKHGWTVEYEYKDSSIVKTFYDLDDSGKKHYYLRNGVKEPSGFKRVYTKGEDGKFYDQYGSKFSIAGDDLE